MRGHGHLNSTKITIVAGWLIASHLSIDYKGAVYPIPITNSIS